MSADNVYRDTTAVDLLNKSRLDQASNAAGNTAANNFTPDYVLQPSDIVNIADDVQINSGQQTPSDVMNITDSVSVTSQNTGTFLIDTAKIGFADVG